MKKAKQLSFLPPEPRSFGGSNSLGKRKESRPVSSRFPMHVILKSTQAKGKFSFVNHQWKIQKLISALSQKTDNRLLKVAINFNHIHLLIHFSSKRNYQSWIRQLTAAIVAVIGASGEFFTERPFSRIGDWGRQLKTLLSYFELNEMELVGLRPRKKTRHRARVSRSTQALCIEVLRYPDAFSDPA